MPRGKRARAVKARAFAPEHAPPVADVRDPARAHIHQHEAGPRRNAGPSRAIAIPRTHYRASGRASIIFQPLPEGSRKPASTLP